MKVTMMLADAAQAVNGKLYILGGGWSLIGPDPTVSAIALKIEVDWNDANRRHQFHLELLDADGQAVRLPTPEGEQTVEVRGDFEVGRPAGLIPGTPLDAAIAINIGPLPLTPGRRFVWRVTINGHTTPEWEVGFTTRPALPQQQ